MFTRLLLVSFIAFCLSKLTYAQRVSPLWLKETNSQELKVFSQTRSHVFEQEHKKLLGLAQKYKWSLSWRTASNGYVALRGVDRLGNPIYFRTFNARAAYNTKTDLLYPNALLNINLNGSSNFLTGNIAVWDETAAYGKHREFADNRTVVVDNAAQTSDHSTHVTGTMMAKGVTPQARGMAWGLKQLRSYDWDNDIAELAQAGADGLLISNHSYGSLSGWNFNDAKNRWEWYGLDNANEDWKFGFYGPDAHDFDSICYKAPYLLPVRAAGNARGESGPSIGNAYWVYVGNTWVLSNARSASIYSQTDYDLISPEACAKNILTVGAVTGLSIDGYGSNTITTFSSWGPTDDGRIKPDIVGVGYNIFSCSSAGASSYIYESGTSMASPQVAGSLVLLQEYYAQKNEGRIMRAATLKALAIHNADDMGNIGPDYIYGWGMLNMQKAANVITQNGTYSSIAENMLKPSETQLLKVRASGKEPLRVTICWTDPVKSYNRVLEGLIDNIYRQLVNDLDVRIQTDYQSFYPWALNPDLPSNVATKADNVRDNVEQIYIETPIAGQEYTIQINHKSSLLPVNTKGQAYSLIMSGIGGVAYCTASITRSVDIELKQFQLNNINFSFVPGSISTDFTSQLCQLEQGQSYTITLTLSSTNNTTSKSVGLFFDWNNDGIFNSDESVALSSTGNANSFTTLLTVPFNLSATTSRLRIISIASSITPTIGCGNVGIGQFADFSMNIIPPAYDVALVDFDIPKPSGFVCPNENYQVGVKIKNVGTKSITNLQIMAKITDSSGQMNNFTGNYTSTVLVSQEVSTLLLNGNFIPGAQKSYTLSTTITASGDRNISNNTLNKTLLIQDVAKIDSTLGKYCTANQVYVLNAFANQNIAYWYKNVLDTVPVTYGNSTEYVSNTSYSNLFVGLNDFKGQIGLKNKNIFPDGDYGVFSPEIKISTKVPVVFTQAVLYVGTAGKIKISVRDTAGVDLSSVVFKVVPTRISTLTTNNDVNDLGKVYPLNLTFPKAGNYTIAVDCYDGATLFRNKNIPSGKYPFTFGSNLVSISGNTATDTYYYYFYDIGIQAMGCSSKQKSILQQIPTYATEMPNIIQKFNTLITNHTSNNQWYYGNTSFSTTLNNLLYPQNSGIYFVKYTHPQTGCVAWSNNYLFSTPRVLTEYGMSAFPNPTSGDLTLYFKLENTSDLDITLIDMNGRTVYSDNVKKVATDYQYQITLPNLPNGIYSLNTRVNNSELSYKQAILLIR